MNLLCKQLLECPVFIIPMDLPDKQMRLILKIIEERGKARTATRVIAISPYTAWNHSVEPKTLERIPRTEFLSYLRQPLQLKSADMKTFYQKVRSPETRYQSLVDNSIRSLRQFPSIRATILYSGLIYGKDFPENCFHDTLANAYNKESLVCYGIGDNWVPTVYIDDLVSKICEAVLGTLERSEELVVDKKQSRQLDIL